MTPINTGGYYHIAPGGSGWGQLNVPGAVLPLIDGVTVPLNATGMLIQAVGDTELLFSPATALGGATGMTLAAGQFLWVAGRANIYQFVVNLGNNFCLQFYSGDDNAGPFISATDGGGGGGSITAVTATLPLTSSGGATPNIAISPATTGQVLQYNATTSAWERCAGLNGLTSYVDGTYGDDATAQPNNPFRPYETLQAALNNYANVSLIECRGSATYAITSMVEHNYVINCPNGVVDVSVGYGFNAPGRTLVINGDVAGVFHVQESTFIVNGNLTGNAYSFGSAGFVVINGNLTGNIQLSSTSGKITINGNTSGTCTFSNIGTVEINGGTCGAITGTYGTLLLNDAIVASINGSNGAHPILVKAKNSTCLAIPTNVTMQSGTTGSTGFFAEAVTFPIGTVTDGTVRLVKFSQPTTIIKAVVESDAGTTTLSIALGGTPVTGLSAIAIGTGETTATATAANHAAAGDYLSFTFSSTSSCTGVTVTLYYQEIVP